MANGTTGFKLNVFGVVLIVFACTLLSAAGADALTLSTNGRSDYSIVIANDAIAPEKTAAIELQKYLSEVTGANLPVVTELQADPLAPKILVGRTEGAKALLKGLDWKNLGKDGIVIKTVGNSLVLSGGQPRGTLYAVYTFLEDTVGCRWWTGTESTIPNKPTLTIGLLNTQYVPKLEYREAFYDDPMVHPLFGAKLKLNGHFYNIPANYGGHYSLIGWCHTLYSLIPPATYQKDHPEWFSSGQLCLSNEDMRKELVKNALEWIKKDPGAGMVSISQNDGGGPCECEKCKAVFNEEGSYSGSIIRFVNKVAEDIEKEYPDFYIETLAYHYSRKPPRHVKPRHNVVVRFCSYECVFTWPIEHKVNREFSDDMKRWAAISPHLYVWDYVANFTNVMIPHPNIKPLAPNIRFFVKNNAMGIFEHGDAFCSVGDFVRLRAWLIGHLLWNPDLDEKALTREFLSGYYGAAGQYVEKYLDLVHDASQQKDTRLGCYHQNVSFMNLDELNEAARLFNQAEKAVAGNKTLLARVQRDRMTFDHVWLLRYKELKQTSEKENKPFLGPKDLKEACKRWIKQARFWKVRQYSEMASFESYAPSLMSRCGILPNTVDDIKKLPASDVIVVEEDKFSLEKVGEWCKIVDDPKASNGKAAWMPGGHYNWAVQFRVPKEWAKEHPGKWYWYAVMRCEGASSGPAFSCGIFNTAPYTTASALNESLEQGSDGPYHVYNLGSFELKSDYYFWSQPTGGSEQVKGIYVDKIVFVRDKEGV